ncbi:MAG: pirin family protein [Pseudomonadota bacterium]
MLEKRPFETLGHANHGWLNARHHFSFGQYFDRDRVHWGALRVWNDDEIAAKSGFPTHPHQDMEIITYVRQGAITHRDSMGNEGRTEAGDVQVMSAGTGIQHSEFNLEDEETRLFQIWIIPRERGGEPRWDARAFPGGDRSGRLEVLASGYAQDISNGALEIRADARLYAATLQDGESVTYAAPEGQVAYAVPSKGTLLANDVTVNTRDGIALSGNSPVTFTAQGETEIVLVETADNITMH